ncbi:hypothetical protein F0562_029164 [Nyssa sinensis]|uniref:Uncharacterized protein n=1 Tax=Nyssa sinensis TaxID=561372 RepID=A0A5J5B370_9ASTE|nr:hypothetical protein F0562_029164 [Nyssa sinensis]
MGGNNKRQMKSSSPFSAFNIFKTKKSSSANVEDAPVNNIQAYKVWRSDEYRGRWVAEPELKEEAMGGNNKKQMKSSSPFSAFNIFKTKKSSSANVEDVPFNNIQAYKVWRSDEYRGRWVAEPGIDMKASAYIAKRYAATHQVSEN